MSLFFRNIYIKRNSNRIPLEEYKNLIVKLGIDLVDEEKMKVLLQNTET